MRKFGILLALVLSFWINEGMAFQISQKFMVEVGVFDAAEVKLNYNENNEEYDISAEVKTANFFGSIYPFLGIYEATGINQKNGVKPVVYKNQTKSRNHKRTKTIFYNDDGVAYKRISTKDERKNEVAIENVPVTANASDLQTVFAEMFKNVIENRNCTLDREIYDGKKHYRIVAKNEGVENRWFDYLKTSNNAYKCSLYIENLKENNDNILWDISAETPINLWFGINKKDNLPKILEIKIDSTPLGAVQVTPSNSKN